MKILLFTLSLLLSSPVIGQINITLLHELVADSKKEHEKQSTAKSNQKKNAFHEEMNRNLMGQVKAKYRAVQDRFAKLNLLIEAVGLAAMADPLIRSIIDHQEQIVFYCQNDPSVVPLALKTEELFVKQSYALMNYIIGLMVSSGELNQMKVSERRLLLRHVLQELQAINRLTRTTSQSLESHIRRKSGRGLYSKYLVEASGAVDEILANIQVIKK